MREHNEHYMEENSESAYGSRHDVISIQAEIEPYMPNYTVDASLPPGRPTGE